MPRGKLFIKKRKEPNEMDRKLDSSLIRLVEEAKRYPDADPRARAAN